MNKVISCFLKAGCAVFAAAALLGTGSSAAGDYDVLYSFSGGSDGGDPATGLIFDRLGNAYGTTATGGLSGCGTVFKLKPTGAGKWQESVLYSFTCFGDGKNPYGGVTFDRAGNLYGTTVAGGSGGACAGDGCGTVFELTPKGETVLYSFTGGKDGFGPGGGVVFDKAGNLYGTTPDGGAHSAGVVYQLSHKTGHWVQTVIHAFTGGKDGGVGSLGLLLLDKAGNLYGVTELGGAHKAGTVFELSPTAGGTWKLTTLYAFKGMPDAGSPYGGLIGGAAGNLYGTTYFGGTHGSGTVFELSPSSVGVWIERVLYDFKGGTDGSLPTSTPAFDRAGNLFGTTSTGGNPGCDCGTIFKLGFRFRTESIVHRFGTGTDGASPTYGLSPDSSGNLYAVTPVGGVNGQGAIFEFTP